MTDKVDAARRRLFGWMHDKTPGAAANALIDDFEAAIRAESEATVADCRDLRSLLYRILTSAEYQKMEAEGLAAAALGLRWSEKDDRYVGGPVR